MEDKMNRELKPLYITGRIIMLACFVALFCLIANLFRIQVLEYDEYQDLTIEQYTKEIAISAKRGTIYDTNMKVLATSVTVDRVFIAPNKIPQMTVRDYIEQEYPSDKLDNEEKRLERQRFESHFSDMGITVAEDIANELSTLLEDVDKADIMEKSKKLNRADETIKRQAEIDESNAVREMIVNKHYEQMIHLAESTRRFYPFNSLASHVIGITGYDGNGLSGVEAYYDSYLKGVPGKVVTARNGIGGDMPFKYESYISAQNGTNIMLTLDWTIQHLVESELEKALTETKATNRVCAIVMNVKTGAVLAMSTKPDFDLNNPYVLDEASIKIAEQYDGTEEEKAQYRTQLLYALWKNKAITELYEPGSTFKVITAAMAIEEKLVNEHETFYCPGYYHVEGYPKPIRCHKHGGHGTLPFADGIKYSCNPVFMMVGQRIGNQKFYEYYEAFGYGDKTGIDLPGEAQGIWHKNFGPVELAISAFGQTFKVTPIQQIAAIAAVANGGNLVTPHVLKATVDENGTVIENYQPEVKRQVISAETSALLCSYLERGVSTDGSARNAYVSGYRVAAKTGTSEKRDKFDKNGEASYRIGSCIGFAPANDPQIAVLVMIDEPSAGAVYGGTIAAPVVSNILSESLPYLNVESQYSDEEAASIETALNDYRNMNVEDAKLKVKQDGFAYKIMGSGTVVTEQIPKRGNSLTKGGTIVLYTDKITPEDDIEIPNVVGMTATRANEVLTNKGLNISLAGVSVDKLAGAIVVSQSPQAGIYTHPGSIVSVDFRHESTD
ncbi:MAG: PASTA domain-containing protein [Ruminococcaceae bacterium]|nr:PASTA domain-containing protein [Oscillospiraceae bacterium]